MRFFERVKAAEDLEHAACAYGLRVSGPKHVGIPGGVWCLFDKGKQGVIAGSLKGGRFSNFLEKLAVWALAESFKSGLHISRILFSGYPSLACAAAALA